jgi:hypothetical protein
MSYRDMERTSRVPQAPMASRPDALSSSAAEPPVETPAPVVPADAPADPAPAETPKT